MTIPKDTPINAELIDNEFPDSVDGGKPVQLSEYFGIPTAEGKLPSGVGTERSIAFNNFKGVTFSTDSLQPTTIAIEAIDADKSEGDSGTTPFIFRITRSGNITGSSSVSWAVSGTGANPANVNDFDGGQFPSGSVSFSPGQTTSNISISVRGDTTLEETERFVVRLSDPVGATISVATAIGIIRNDDATVSIQATDADKPEGDSGVTEFTFTVTRSRNVAGESSVSWTVVRTGLNPANASDFIGGIIPSGTVSFASGESSKLITIQVLGNTLIEPDKTFSVTIFNPVNVIIDVSTAEAIIRNDDSVLSIASVNGGSPVSISEGNSGSTTFAFIVNRTGNLDRLSSVSWSVVGSGLFPASPDDFVGGIFPSGTVSFALGESSQIIAVNVVGDLVFEDNETFTISIFNPVGATISTNSATAIIINDDSILSLTAFDSDKSEGNSGVTPFTFTVTRSGSVIGDSSATWSVVSSGTNAAIESDFEGGVFPSGTVSFSQSETTKTITVNVVGDEIAESDETFTVILSNPVNCLLGNSTIVGVIRNDDTNLSIFADDADKAQSSSGITTFTFNVNRTGNITGISSARWTVNGSGGTPATAADFQGGIFPTGIVSFLAGETLKPISINVAEGLPGETDETFSVNLSQPSGATILTSSATGIIRGDGSASAGPALSIFANSADKLEGDSGSTPFTFTVNRTGNTDSTSSATWSVSGSGAKPANAADFSGGIFPSGTVTFSSGESFKVITINVAGDVNPEDDETFVVTLSNPVNATILVASAIGTIRNDESVLSILSASQQSSVTEQFMTSSSTETNGWVGVGNTTNGNNYGWNASSIVTGNGGCAGGIFARTEQNAYYADVTIDPLFRTDTFSMSGSFRLSNNNFDGVFHVGYFNPSKLVNRVIAQNFVGIEIFEPASTSSGSFRSRVRVNGTSGAASNIIELQQNTIITFNLIWSGGIDGSGTLSGTLAGQPVNVVVGSGLDEFTAFGLLSGGLLNTTSTVRTSSCFFDDLTYQKDEGESTIKFEGNSGTTPFIFTVNRSGNISSTASVSWAVSGSSPNPANASDFSGGTFPTGIVSFAAGQAVQVINVNVSGDTEIESDENFIVTLSNPVNSSISIPSASSVIRSDDSGLSIVATDADITENPSGFTPFTFTVNRTGGTSGQASVSWSVTGSGDTPASAEDFQGGVFPSGTVNFAAGETSKDIIINVIGNTLANPVISIVPKSYSVLEGNSGITTISFEISRSGNTLETSSASWQVAGIGTTDLASTSDFQGNVFPSGTVSFAQGETTKNIDVNILGDTQIEANEEFRFIISNPIGATIGVGSTSAFILNDDSEEEVEIIEPDTSIVQTFDTLSSTTSAGWLGVGNTSNLNNFGWNASSIVTGSGGCIGGTFARSTQPAYFADVTISELSRTSTLRMAGTFRLQNNNFDGLFFVGYFSPETVIPATLPENFIGLEISEPVGLTTNPFRGKAIVSGVGGTVSNVISLPQNTNLTFDLTWTGKSDGSGTFIGTFAGQSVNISAESRLATFDAFGLLNGGFSSSSSVRTGVCLFDDLRYRKGEIPPPEEEPLPTLSIFPVDADKPEGNSGISTFTFNVVRQGVASTFSSAVWTVTGTGSSQASASDFQGNQFPSGTVLFPSGQTNQLISINVNGDADIEETETFAVTLSNPVGSTLGVTTAVGIIRNDDAPSVPTFSIGPATINKAEGNSGITTFTFAVTRGVVTTGISTVQWDVTGSGSNPANAQDFSGDVFPSGSLTFSAGITTQNINVNVKGDTTDESNETFSVNLKNAVNGIIVTGTAIGTINNDDISTDSFVTRANWMINSYANVTIGSNSTSAEGINNSEARKFGWAEVLAKLKINENNPTAKQQVISRFVTLIDRNEFNVSFMPAGSAWILCKYWNDFSSDQKATLLTRFKAVSNVADHGTENHFLIKYVGAYLWTAVLWPDETGWFNSITKKRESSADFAAFTKTRLLTVLRSLYDKGLSENLSTNYLSVHLYPLHALYSCATDPEVKLAAEAALNFHLANCAANFFEGNTLSPFNRDSETGICDPQKNITLNTLSKAVHWLYWAELMNTSSTTSASFNAPDAQSYGGAARHYAVTSALSDWTPSPKLKELAAGTSILPFSLKSSECNFGEFGVGEPSFTERTIYRESLYALGSGNYVTSFKNNNGLSQRYGLELVYKSSDDQNTIVIHHPYWRTNTQSGTFINKAGNSEKYTAQKPWLSRSSPFQQNVQTRSTVISLFNIPTADPFKYKTRIDWEPYRAQFFDQLINQAWVRFPKTIDEMVETSGWIFLREGEVYIAIRPCNGYPSIITTEFSDLDVVRSTGSKNAVIMDVATSNEFSSFASFRTTVLTAPLTFDANTPSVSYRNTRGETIVATWGAIDTSRVDVKSFPTATINDVSQVMHDVDFIAAKAVIKSTPISLVNRVLTVNVPSGQLKVDWIGSIPTITGL